MGDRVSTGRPTHVLDASAVLAVLLGETGSERVQEAGPDGLISAVNLSEVVAVLLDRGVILAIAAHGLKSLSLRVAVFDSSRAEAAGELRDRTRDRNISFGDRACLALALETRLPVVTGDRGWKDLGLPLDIRLIR